jgi:hypothetical protein
MSRSLEEIQDKLVAPSRVRSEQGERCSRYRLASTTTAPTTNCSSLYSAATRRASAATAWQRLGRQVRKGERGIQILAPCRKG